MCHIWLEIYLSLVFNKIDLVFLAFFYKERLPNYYTKVKLHIGQLQQINWNDLEMLKI